MRLTIESTNLTADLDGVPVRVWDGLTEQGHPITVYVHRFMVPPESQAEFDAAVARGEVLETVAPSNSGEDAVIYSLRSQLLELFRRHEAHCPGGGKPCWTNRANAIAFLAHALGLGFHVGGMIEVISQLASYDDNCKESQCGHHSGKAKP